MRGTQQIGATSGGPPSALAAFSRGLNRPPVYSNDAEAWSGLAVCEWELPWLDGFELAENSDFVVAYHSAGSRRVRAACNGPWSDTRSTPGLISVIPPGRRVEYRIDGAVSFSSIHIPARTIEAVTGAQRIHAPEFRFAFHDNFASACMDTLLDQAHHQSVAPRADRAPLIDAVTRALLLHLMRDDGPAAGVPRSTEPEPWLNSALAFIDDRLSLPLKLEVLAREVGMSRAHFVRQFRGATGESPHRYITLRRVARAKELLQGSSTPLVTIAQETGFNSQSHFTQVFHAITGSTPGDFRAAARTRTRS